MKEQFPNTSHSRNREVLFKNEPLLRNEVHPDHWLRLGVLGLIVTVVCSTAIFLIWAFYNLT